MYPPITVQIVMPTNITHMQVDFKQNFSKIRDEHVLGAHSLGCDVCACVCHIIEKICNPLFQFYPVQPIERKMKKNKYILVLIIKNDIPKMRRRYASFLFNFHLPVISTLLYDSTVILNIYVSGTYHRCTKI